MHCASLRVHSAARDNRPIARIGRRCFQPCSDTPDCGGVARSDCGPQCAPRRTGRRLCDRCSQRATAATLRSSPASSSALHTGQESVYSSHGETCRLRRNARQTASGGPWPAAVGTLETNTCKSVSRHAVVGQRGRPGRSMAAVRRSIHRRAPCGSCHFGGLDRRGIACRDCPLLGSHSSPDAPLQQRASPPSRRRFGWFVDLPRRRGPRRRPRRRPAVCRRPPTGCAGAWWTGTGSGFPALPAVSSSCTSPPSARDGVN